MQTIKLTVELAFAWWNTPVNYSVHVDSLCLGQGLYNGKLLTPTSYTYVVPVTMDWHEIVIRLDNKKDTDIYKIPNTDAIIRDKYIDVKRIFINNLGFPPADLIRLGGMFYNDLDVDNPIKTTMIKDNGAFKFKFKAPFEYWALQTLVTD
jgi:hypothetical protein